MVPWNPAPRSRAEQTRAGGAPHKPLIAILAIALVLRLAMVPLTGIHHPDELFQYLEQAHRLIFGQGVIPWEYRYQMRSWLLPLLLVPPMRIGDAIAPDSMLYLWLPRAVAACTSLSIVWSAWAFGERISRLHALIAGTIAAIWIEFIFFAPHILSETASIALILPAAALLTEPKSPRTVFLAGAMLGTALIFRVQHGPAIATLLGLTLWDKRNSWLPTAIGIAAALAIGAGIDIAMHQTPFAWAIEYVRQNIVNDRASAFGTAPYWAYGEAIVLAFGWWTIPLLALAAIGARRQALLLRVALGNLALHMAIGHKEYRFILLTTAILAILAAIGTGELVAMAARRWPQWRRSAAGAALLLWAAASINLAADGHAGVFDTKDANGLTAFRALHDDPALCGFATMDLHFAMGGGYTYLHRAVPYYSYGRGEVARLQQDAPGFNRLIQPIEMAPSPGFTPLSCFAKPGSHALCILARPGGCKTIVSAAEVNRGSLRRDE